MNIKKRNRNFCPRVEGLEDIKLLSIPTQPIIDINPRGPTYGNMGNVDIYFEKYKAVKNAEKFRIDIKFSALETIDHFNGMLYVNVQLPNRKTVTEIRVIAQKLRITTREFTWRSRIYEYPLGSIITAHVVGYGVGDSGRSFVFQSSDGFTNLR
jgi:hypothetical protein